MKEQLKHVDRDCLEEVLIGIPYKGETMKTQKRNLKKLIGNLKKISFQAVSPHIFLPKFCARTLTFILKSQPEKKLQTEKELQKNIRFTIRKKIKLQQRLTSSSQILLGVMSTLKSYYMRYDVWFKKYLL